MIRFRIFALFAALFALAATFSACGGESVSSNPQEVVDEATLQGIESGNIDLSLGFEITGRKSGHVDVSVSGPFQEESDEELPELDLIAKANGSVGDEKVDFDGGLTLLGNKAYVAYKGTEYEVDPTTFNYIKSMVQQRTGGEEQAGEATACREAASQLRVADFVENLRSDGSADVGDTGTTKVSGDLDAPAAIEALIEIVEDPVCGKQLEAADPLPSIAELKEARDEVKQGVKVAHVELYVGDDHIVRRISAQITIEPPKDSGRGAKRVEVDLDLKFTDVNEDQTISAPSSSQPLSNLFVKLGINPIELLGALNGQGGPDALGDLLGRIGGNSDDGSSDGGQSYYECLQGARTAADLKKCVGLLQ